MANDRTSTLSSCSPAACTSTTVAGLWSVEPIAGCVVTLSSNSAWAGELCEEAPLLPALFPLELFTTRMAATAISAAPSTTAAATRTGLRASDRRPGPPGDAPAEGSTEGGTRHHRAFCQR